MLDCQLSCGTFFDGSRRFAVNLRRSVGTCDGIGYASYIIEGERAASMRTRIFILCCLICGLGTIGVRAARAQSKLEVPGPANQNQPYVPPASPPLIRLAPSGGDNGNTIQLLPQLNQPPAQPQPAATPPPPPPRSERRADDGAGGARAAGSIPRMLAGAGQSSSIGFGASRARIKSVSGRRRPIGCATSKSAINRSSSRSPRPGSSRTKRLSIARGKVVPIATDGREYAAMRSRLNFDEYQTHFDGIVADLYG